MHPPARKTWTFQQCAAVAQIALNSKLLHLRPNSNLLDPRPGLHPKTLGGVLAARRRGSPDRSSSRLLDDDSEYSGESARSGYVAGKGPALAYQNLLSCSVPMDIRVFVPGIFIQWADDWRR